MDVSLLIRHRLKELGLEQKDLALAAEVTESYISQLLGRKKAPPASGRTDLYDKMGEFLRLPKGELSKLADLQRQEELKKRITEPAAPLFKDCRDLILRKCAAGKRNEIEKIVEKQPFGEFERLVTQKLLDVAQAVAREELRNEDWLQLLAELSGGSLEQTRVDLLEFLDKDVFNFTVENSFPFLNSIISSWDIDLRTFGMEVVLNPRLAARRVKRLDFVEREPEQDSVVEPGFAEFLQTSAYSADITGEEIDFLRSLKFKGRRPSPLYYYRELQNLRDPLHFPPIEKNRSHA